MELGQATNKHPNSGSSSPSISAVDSTNIDEQTTPIKKSNDESEMTAKTKKSGDIIGGGATFEIEGQRDDFAIDSDDELSDDGDLPEEATKPNPGLNKFFEMKAQMVQVSSYLYKKTLSEGNREIPMGSQVSIHYNGYFEGSPISFDSTYMRGKPVVFFLGKGDILFGLEQAVATMKRHEEAQFIISWNWLYGEHGCLPRIKPKADALFIIRVMDSKELTVPVELTDDGEITPFFQKFQEFVKYNGLAKDAFKRSNFPNAISNYQKAIDEIDKCPLKDEKEEKLYNEHLQKTFLNLAVCYNNVQLPKKACSMLNNLKQLGGFDGNPKAWYHEGKALEAIGDYDRARVSLMRAKEMTEHNIEVNAALKSLDEKIDKYNKESRRIAQNALGMILKKTTITDKEDKKKASDNNDVEADNKYTRNVNEFLDSKLPSLLLPNQLSNEEIAALRSLEKKMGFKVTVTNTGAEREIRLIKTEKPAQ